MSLSSNHISQASLNDSCNTTFLNRQDWLLRSNILPTSTHHRPLQSQTTHDYPPCSLSRVSRSFCMPAEVVLANAYSSEATTISLISNLTSSAIRLRHSTYQTLMLSALVTDGKFYAIRALSLGIQLHDCVGVRLDEGISVALQGVLQCLPWRFWSSCCLTQGARLSP